MRAPGSVSESIARHSGPSLGRQPSSGVTHDGAGRRRLRRAGLRPRDDFRLRGARLSRDGQLPPRRTVPRRVPGEDLQRLRRHRRQEHRCAAQLRDGGEGRDRDARRAARHSPFEGRRLSRARGSDRTRGTLGGRSGAGRGGARRRRAAGRDGTGRATRSARSLEPRRGRHGGAPPGMSAVDSGAGCRRVGQ